MSIFSEVQTARFEVGNLVNERENRIHLTNPKQGKYLSPNHLLLGRSGSQIPSGSFREPPTSDSTLSNKLRRVFLRQWQKKYFGCLIVHQK